MKRHHQRRCPRRVSHGSFILLGTSDGLKGCASPTGKRRLRALTPSSAPSSWLTCRVALTLSAPEGCHFYFARRVTFLSCADITSARRLAATTQSGTRICAATGQTARYVQRPARYATNARR
jgi:hypothetical protein